MLYHKITNYPRVASEAASRGSFVCLPSVPLLGGYPRKFGITGKKLEMFHVTLVENISYNYITNRHKEHL